MDESTHQQVNVEIMTSQESYLTEIVIFQEFVSGAKVTKKSLINGWKNYYHFALIRKEMNLGKPPEERVEAPEMLFEAVNKRLKIMRGENIALTESEKTAYPSLFSGDTLGTSPVGGQLGILLEGLTDEKLENAKLFCKAMNGVGLELGDIDKAIQAS